MLVHRVLALLLVPALIATSGLGSLLHTHAYSDHDHPEHHHGLAAHEHHSDPAHQEDGGTRIEGCDPGEHVVSQASLCAAVPPAPVVLADLGAAALHIPDLLTWHSFRYSDVRVHGPPPRDHASPRAPPLIAPA